MMSIVPAVIPQSLQEIFSVAKRIQSFSRELHIDVVDGVFVENISWPYGALDMKGSPNEVHALADMFAVEIDLMIDNAIEEIPRWIDARAQRLVVHSESCFDLAEARRLCDAAHRELGVAASNDTPLDLYLDALTHAHYAQCMGIRHIGVQGEPFDESVLDRIRAVHARFPSMTVSVDGSVNTKTIERMRDAGATRFIAGSAIVSASDSEAAYTELVSLVHK